MFFKCSKFGILEDSKMFLLRDELTWRHYTLSWCPAAFTVMRTVCAAIFTDSLCHFTACCCADWQFLTSLLAAAPTDVFSQLHYLLLYLLTVSAKTSLLAAVLTESF
jgi:hypothetical protein